MWAALAGRALWRVEREIRSLRPRYAVAVGDRPADREAALDLLDNFCLEGIAQKIEAPLLVVHGEKDHLVPFDDAERLAKAAPKGELVATTADYGGEGHCCMDGMQTGVDLIYDWLAEKLGARRPDRVPMAGREGAVRQFRRYPSRRFGL